MTEEPGQQDVNKTINFPKEYIQDSLNPINEFFRLKGPVDLIEKQEKRIKNAEEGNQVAERFSKLSGLSVKGTIFLTWVQMAEYVTLGQNPENVDNAANIIIIGALVTGLFKYFSIVNRTGEKRLQAMRDKLDEMRSRITIDSEGEIIEADRLTDGSPEPVIIDEMSIEDLLADQEYED